MKLRVIQGRHLGAEVEIDAEQIVVGSADDVDVVLSDDSVRPRHALLRRQIGGWEVSAADEAPLSLNGVPLEQPALLRAGDVVRLGDAEVAFVNTPGPVPAAGAMPMQTIASEPPAPPPPARAKGPVVALALSVAIACTSMAVLVGGTDRRAVEAVAGAVPLSDADPDPSAVVAALSERGWPHVRAQSVGGVLQLHGVVASDAELTQLRQWVASHLPQAAVAVQSAPAMVALIRTQLDDPGVTVAYADGRLQFAGQAARASTASRIVRWRAELLRHVETSSSVAYVTGESEHAKPAKGSFPMKIASLSTAETPYIETAGGARYFEGSTLADGAVLRSIRSDAIVVEQAGRLTEYRVLD